MVDSCLLVLGLRNKTETRAINWHELKFRSCKVSQLRPHLKRQMEQRILLICNNILGRMQHMHPVRNNNQITRWFRGCSYGGGPALLVGLALFAEISRLSKILCQNLFSFIWEEGQPSLAGSRYWLPRSRLGGLEIFHINALKRVKTIFVVCTELWLARRASKLKLRSHDKDCLDQM